MAGAPQPVFSYAKPVSEFHVGCSASIDLLILGVEPRLGTVRPSCVVGRCLYSGLNVQVVLWGSFKDLSIIKGDYWAFRNTDVVNSRLCYNRAGKFGPAIHTFEFRMTVSVNQAAARMNWDGRRNAPKQCGVGQLPLIADVFSGIGGAHCVATACGIPVIAALDSDKCLKHGCLLNHNFPEKCYCEGDIGNRKTWAALGPAHIWTGGFPCQPYSGAGAGRGLRDERSKPIFDLISAAELHRPTFLCLENSWLITTTNFGRDLSTIIDAFRDIGYAVKFQKRSLLDCIPQHRIRATFLIFDTACGDISQIQGFRMPCVSLVSHRALLSKNDPRLADFVLSDELRRVYLSRKHLPWQGYPRVVQHDSSHVATIQAHYADGHNLIKANIHAVHGSVIKTGRIDKAGQELYRFLHFSEALSLQGFPPSFALPSGPILAYHAIGNACPPIFMLPDILVAAKLFGVALDFEVIAESLVNNAKLPCEVVEAVDEPFSLDDGCIQAPTSQFFSAVVAKQRDRSRSPIRAQYPSQTDCVIDPYLPSLGAAIGADPERVDLFLRIEIGDIRFIHVTTYEHNGTSG